jgi:hypothetical protein
MVIDVRTRIYVLYVDEMAAALGELGCRPPHCACLALCGYNSVSYRTVKSLAVTSAA